MHEASVYMKPTCFEGFTVGTPVGGGVGPHVTLPKVVLSSVVKSPPFSFISIPHLEML